MLVGEIISERLITLKANDDVRTAFELMRKNAIRHIPVLSGEKLVAIVTNTDLRQVITPSRSEGSGEPQYFVSRQSTVEDIMTRDPITVTLQTDVEEAARLLQVHKIGGLPVVEGDKLVGIITESDILTVFIEMMGVIKYSSRVDVVLGEDADAFQNISRIIRENSAEIISVGMSAEGEKETRVHYFRLDTDDVNSVAGAIEDQGYEVVSIIGG